MCFFRTGKDGSILGSDIPKIIALYISVHVFTQFLGPSWDVSANLNASPRIVSGPIVAILLRYLKYYDRKVIGK